MESFDDIRKSYPFDRWMENVKYGLDQYTPENCKKAKNIADKLIDKLIKLQNKGTEEQKVALFKEAVLSYNNLNGENESIIETEEREDLCELLDKIAVAAGLNPQKYGDGEGIATEWRDW
jgi:hypothetical protein